MYADLAHGVRIRGKETTGKGREMDVASFEADLLAVAGRLRAAKSPVAPPVVAPPVLANEWMVQREAIEAAFEKATAAAKAGARLLVEAHAAEQPDSPLFSPISLYRAMGHVRFETSHTHSLAWLLDARNPHGFGNTLLRALLGAVDLRDHDRWRRARDRIEASEADYAVATEWLVDRGSRLDILIESVDADDQWELRLEAKVDALERPAQLSDYDPGDRHTTLCVFLTPDGTQGKSSAAKTPWATLSFKALARAFLRLCPNLRDRAGFPFLRLYLTGVLDDICQLHCGDKDRVLSHNSVFDLAELLEDAHG